MRHLHLLLLVSCLAAVTFPAAGQSAPLAAEAAQWEHVRLPLHPTLTARPPLHTELVLMQTAAGLAGGIVGSLTMVLPFALAEMGGKRDVPDGVPIVAAVLGYFGGSALGVQLFSRSVGMRGSWWWTLGGATVGSIGGPAFLVTVPVGAVIGYNRTRDYRSEPAP